MLDSIEEIIENARLGKPFIIADDENRENEGDIIASAQFINIETIKLMMIYARGLICVAIDQSVADRFDLKLHPRRNIHDFETAFTYSIDAKDGISTGISAMDKVHTISKLVNRNSTIDDFKIPGHIYPVIARKKGVLERRGHTEAAIDIARLANLKPVMVICEIVNDDGTMARKDNLLEFAKAHNIRISSVERLVQYIKKQ